MWRSIAMSNGTMSCWCSQFVISAKLAIRRRATTNNHSESICWHRGLKSKVNLIRTIERHYCGELHRLDQPCRAKKPRSQLFLRSARNQSTVLNPSIPENRDGHDCSYLCLKVWTRNMRAAALSRSRKLAILRSEISRSVTCETNGASIQSMCRRRMFPSQMISEIIFPSKRS